MKIIPLDWLISTGPKLSLATAQTINSWEETMPPIKYVDSDNVDGGVDHLDATFSLLPALS